MNEKQYEKVIEILRAIRVLAWVILAYTTITLALLIAYLTLPGVLK